MNPIPLVVFGLTATVLSCYAHYREQQIASIIWQATATVIMAIAFAVVMKPK
jgi:hypothetical protein